MIDIQAIPTIGGQILANVWYFAIFGEHVRPHPVGVAAELVVFAEAAGPPFIRQFDEFVDEFPGIRNIDLRLFAAIAFAACLTDLIEEAGVVETEPFTADAA